MNCELGGSACDNIERKHLSRPVSAAGILVAHDDVKATLVLEPHSKLATRIDLSLRLCLIVEVSSKQMQPKSELPFRHP